MRMLQAALVIAAVMIALMMAPRPAVPAEGKPPVEDKPLALTVAVKGAIGPATAGYIREALKTAEERRATLVILRMNTPGGLASSMREIIVDVLASPVPVIGYVAPSGAHAASAGTYILYATHIAAMAPGTNIGAATPVSIGGPLPGLPDKGKDKDGKDKDGETKAAPKDAMTAKATNDAVALIRSLAELRGRNADWGEKAVRDAATLTANGARDARVIEIIARSEAELLQLIDGRTVELAGGATRQLATKDIAVEAIEPGWIAQLLAAITDPNVAFILLLVGMYGLFFEVTSPGAVAPGVIGAICLLLGFYALNMLPINHAGLGLVLLGIALLVVEAYNPTVVIGLGGVIAFVLGALMLFRTDAPGVRVSWPVIAIAAAMFLGLIYAVLASLRRVRKRPPSTGAHAMRGVSAQVLDWSGGEGHVLTRGERWLARGSETFSPGETVEVADVRDLTLEVRRR